jgi:large subunit ribosomal protein L6
MSRIGKQVVTFPSNVTVDVNDSNNISVKGTKGELNVNINPAVRINVYDSVVNVVPIEQSKEANMHSGTARALINNMVIGVSKGFELKLQLVGVGYRAKSQGKNLSLELGFSHPIHHNIPESVTAETPSQTEIVLKSINKELLGKVAADIRNCRKPEPYKGKGIRYVDEQVTIKEAKKK